jgi:hypothetical protein
VLELALHRRERPNQVADLVAGPVLRHLDRRPLLGELNRRMAQMAQAANQKQ